MLLEIYKILAVVIPACVSVTVIVLKLMAQWKYKIQRDLYKDLIDKWFKERK